MKQLKALKHRVMKDRPEASVQDTAAPVKVSFLDDEMESAINRWSQLSRETQRSQIAPVVETFGAGGP